MKDEFVLKHLTRKIWLFMLLACHQAALCTSSAVCLFVVFAVVIQQLKRTVKSLNLNSNMTVIYFIY